MHYQHRPKIAIIIILLTILHVLTLMPGVAPEKCICMSNNCISSGDLLPHSTADERNLFSNNL